MAALTAGVRRCQIATNFRNAASVQTQCNHWQPLSTQVSCCETTCRIWDAGAIPAASTFSEHASRGVSSRHTTSKAVTAKGVAAHLEEADSRQEATVNVLRRPPCATKSATGPLDDDPDLAVVVAARPELSETVRAEIVALVEAAWGRGVDRS
jgi:hypothetical protein